MPDRRDPDREARDRFGTVEYAERGAGQPVLVCRGVFGCHADAVDGWWIRMLGEGLRVIAPSRFGYFGSTLPPHATPADQVQAYALLLEHLGIGRAAVLAYSAGSASALEFALRHPDRVVGLILANARLGGPTPNKLLKPIQGTVYGWERLWWLYRRLLPSIYGRMVGVPKDDVSRLDRDVGPGADRYRGRTARVPALRSLGIASASGQIGPAPEWIGLDEDRRRSPTTRRTSTQGSTPRPAPPQACSRCNTASSLRRAPRAPPHLRR